MPPLNPDDYLEFEQDTPQVPRFKKTRRNPHAVLDEISAIHGLAALGAEQVFTPTLQAARHEREWIHTYLAHFYDNQVITDILRRVKGGKEANVYVCKGHPKLGMDLVAAKLYRPRMFRNLRNDALYRTNRAVRDEMGKVVTDRRALKAVAGGSRFGQKLRQISWHQTEYTILHDLHQAGLPVPQAVASGDQVLLMQFLGDERVTAPSLVETDLPRESARRIFTQLIEAAEHMLSLGIIHGDLSAYNILFWENAPWIIDFPQAVNPAENPHAFRIFQRDISRICQYFARYGVRTHPGSLSEAIWARQTRHLAWEEPFPMDD